MAVQRRRSAGQLVRPAAGQVATSGARLSVIHWRDGQGRTHGLRRPVHHGQHAGDVTRLELAKCAPRWLPFIPCHSADGSTLAIHAPRRWRLSGLAACRVYREGAG